MLKEFRQNFVGLLTLVVVAFTIYGLVKLGTSATAAPSSNVVPAQSDDLGAADQHMHAAIYTTTEGQTPTLGLNNSQNHPMTAQVTLYNKHGQALAIPPITLGPHQNHGWNIADWVRHEHGFEEGSLEVFYRGPSMALGAQETVTDVNHSLSYDVHLQEPMDFMSPRADGMWWALDDNHEEAEVFVANTSATQTTVTPTFYVGGTAYQGEAIVLNGHESDSIDIDKSLKKLRVHGDTSVGGISLTYTNGPGKLAVVGVISNKHTGFSTTMRFIDQAGQHTTSLHGASILIGKPEANLGFSASARFTPHVFVRNNTNQPVQVNPRIRYTLFDQPNTVTLAAVTLAPNAVRELDLSPAINAIGTNPITDTGIEIDHTGQPGAVMACAASVDQSGSNVIDVPVKDPKSEMGFKGGSYPWHIAGDNRAVLHIKSVDAPTDGLRRQAMAKLYFDGGEYNLPLQQMEAGQTVEVDLKKLRDDQVKDVVGNVIPLNVTGGQLDWSGRANKGEFIGRLIEYNPVSGVASSLSCEGACPCDPGFGHGVINPNIISGFVGDTFGLQALETDPDCNGQNSFTFTVGSPQGLQYSSSNENVITISGDTATLVGPGAAEVTADWDALYMTQHCFLSAEGECVDATCTSRPVNSPIVHDPVESTKVQISSAKNVMDGASAQFSVTVTGPTSASSYSWSFTAPSGAANSPNVTFSSATSASTNTDAHWFALPNIACGASFDATYTIKCHVGLSDAKNKDVQTTLTVNALWSPGGKVDPNDARIAGAPGQRVDENGIWHVSGMGTLSRVVPTKTVLIPMSSQFFTKANAHEQAHVDHWNAGQLFGGLFQPSDFFARVQNFTAASQGELIDKIIAERDKYSDEQRAFVQAHHAEEEQQAYAVSDAIDPRYLYQLCGSGQL